METVSRGTLDPWYVTGFMEGEGTFTYSRSGRQMGLYFGVKVPASHRTILEELQRFFGGVGKIYTVAPRTGATPGGRSKAASYFRVTRQNELERIITHFDQYPLRTAKAESYRIWKDMVILKRSFRRPQRERLNELAQQLSASAARKPAQG